jgi:hypothetical protein
MDRYSTTGGFEEPGSLRLSFMTGTITHLTWRVFRRPPSDTLLGTPSLDSYDSRSLRVVTIETIQSATTASSQRKACRFGVVIKHLHSIQ